MPNFLTNRVTRRSLLKAGALMTFAPIIDTAAIPSAAEAATKAPAKVLDFLTYADVAKAEREGELVYYGHHSEAGIGNLLTAFRKDFPKIKTRYYRAQAGALYSKLLSERSAGRFLADAFQLTDVSAAIDFQKKGGFEHYISPEAKAYKPEYLSNPPGSYFWAGVTFAGIAYNTAKLKTEDAPKNWKDLLNPKYAGLSVKLATSGTQFMQWYILRKLYGDGFWKEFAKLKPIGFDSRAQLYDRLAKGDDKLCGTAEYDGYILYKGKGASIEFVAAPDGLTATPTVLGIVTKAPHPEVAKLFMDWAMSTRGQAIYQGDEELLDLSVRTDAPPMVTGKRLPDFKLLFPTDWPDYIASHDTFVKEWNAIMGL